jgi:hypothetical protein
MSSYRNFFNLSLYYVAGMVCFGWLLSAMDAYRWMGAAALPLACTLAFLFHRSWRVMDPQEKECLKNDLLFPPFLILLLLIALAGCLYITTVLDSLSYRIPRMLMWLQEGKIHYIENPDFRLNFMTPVWEFASTPLYQAAGFRLLWLGSGVSWVLLYLAFVFISRNLGADPKTSRWLAIIPSASVGFVLQAASTMNDVWAAAFIAVSLAFILMFEEKQEFRDLVSSGLALALAAGAKPHFAVLALPWLIWFFFSKSKPIAAIRWKWALPVLALTLTCSPLPTFISNHAHYGSIKGPAGDDGFGMGSVSTNITLGSTMMAWQLFQPPVNPFAEKLEKSTQTAIENTGLHELAPRFKVACRELPMVDSASLGLVTSLILLLGLLLTLRRKPAVSPSIWYAAAVGVFGYGIAVSQVVPGSLGRSFLGFLVPVIPAGLAGLSLLPTKRLLACGSLTVATAIFSLVMSPSHPLWPVKSVAAKWPSVGHHLTKYLTFQERASAGTSLIRKIPDGSREIGVFPTGDQSLIHLWGNRKSPNRVHFFPGDITLDGVHQHAPEFNILIGESKSNENSSYQEIAKQLQSDPRFEILAIEYYISKNQRGPEPWILFRRVPTL